MLVVVRVDSWSYGCTEDIRLILILRIHLKDPSKTDFELDVAILVKVVIPDIFCIVVSQHLSPSVLNQGIVHTIVRKRANHTDDEPAAANCVRPAANTEVCVLP